MLRHAVEHLHRTCLCPGVCRGHDDGSPFRAGSGREFVWSASVLFFADCAGSCRLASLRCDALDTSQKGPSIYTEYMTILWKSLLKGRTHDSLVNLQLLTLMAASMP